MGESSLIHNGADDNASGVALGIALMDVLYDSNKMYNNQLLHLEYFCLQFEL